MIYLQLFWSFVKVGFTSFGGLSMVPLISSEMLSHGWMTVQEVSDIIAIAPDISMIIFILRSESAVPSCRPGMAGKI